MTSSALCGLLFAISTHMHSLKLHAPVFMCEAQMTYKHAGFMEKVRGHAAGWKDFHSYASKTKIDEVNIV